jgi:Acetyltransferase (GNAT) family
MERVMSNMFYGRPEQQDVMRKGWELWHLLRDDHRFSFYGRMVSISDPEGDILANALALIRLQGATSCQFFPNEKADQFCAQIEAAGYRTSVYEQCHGGEAAYQKALQILQESSLPEDLTMFAVSQETLDAQINEIAELSMSCGVMPVTSLDMKGGGQPGICVIATDQTGKVVSTASSYMSNHPDSQRAKDAFWGMLATDTARRGQKIGLTLGAQAIKWMWENEGARSFNTGIQADNPSSLALCAKLSVVPSEWNFIGCTDPAEFGDKGITR